MMIIHLWESLINCMIRKNERIGGEDDKEIQDQAHGR